MIQKAVVIAVLSVLAGTAAAAEIPAPAKPVAAGKLTYGVAATFAPFEFQRDGKLVGFDIELGEAIAAKFGVQAAPLNMEFKGLIPALQGGRIDFINSAMYINDERAKQVDFVPYLKIGNEVIVKKGNPAGVTGRDDSLCGKKIAVTLGGIEETYARQDSKRCTDGGKSAVVVLTFPTAQDSALAVRQGRADVEFDSTPGAVELLKGVPGVYEIAGPTFESNTRIGMAARKGDDATVKALEAALQAVVKDGTYKKLIAKYDLPPTVDLFN
jgi:polar amino acid transport system substrate-binding protein